MRNCFATSAIVLATACYLSTPVLALNCEPPNTVSVRPQEKNPPQSNEGSAPNQTETAESLDKPPAAKHAAQPADRPATTKSGKTKTERTKSAKPPTSSSPVLDEETPPDPDSVSAITFDDLKFDIEPDGEFSRDLLTEKINQLNGRRIRVSGYIRPSFSQSGLTKFIFVRDNKECCFGPGAALYDCMMVKLGKGKKTDYTVRPVALEGKFTLKEFTVGGKTWAIYRMTDAEVK